MQDGWGGWGGEGGGHGVSRLRRLGEHTVPTVERRGEGEGEGAVALGQVSTSLPSPVTARAAGMHLWLIPCFFWKEASTFTISSSATGGDG